MMDNMIDLGILGILGFFAAVGALRGFTGELFSLAIWVCAILVALLFNAPLAAILPLSMLPELFAAIIVPHSRIIAAAMLFAGSVMMGGVARLFVDNLMVSMQFPGNRLMGAMAGLGRGWLAVLVAVILAHRYLPVSGYALWQKSQLLPYFLVMEEQAVAMAAALSGWAAGLLGMGGGAS